MDPLAVFTAAVVGTGLAVLAALTVADRRRAASLGRVLRRLDSLEGRLARLETSASSDPTHAVLPGESNGRPRAGTSRRADRAATLARSGPTLIAVPNLSRVVPPRGTLGARAEMRRRFLAIWERADAGGSAESIARETGQAVGRVELVLNLRRRLNRAESGPTGGPRRP